MVPSTWVPFWVPVFDPQPYEADSKHSPKEVPLALGRGGGGTVWDSLKNILHPKQPLFSAFDP